MTIVYLCILFILLKFQLALKRLSTNYSKQIKYIYEFAIISLGYKMDDLLTSYISLMLTNMNKQKSIRVK